MGWADCGTDSMGRRIGYLYEATCDAPGCKKKIDRGIAYACGDMHGEDEISCEKYFCDAHRQNLVMRPGEKRVYSVCDACRDEFLESGEWVLNDDGVIVYRGPRD